MFHSQLRTNKDNNTETLKCWPEVKAFKDASGENSLSEIFDCVWRTLILSNCNADTERIFSPMNHIKSEIMNNMKTYLLNVILVI